VTRVAVSAPALEAERGRVVPRFAETVLLAALTLGGAWGCSWLAGRLGLRVSRSLVFEGRWIVPSWGVFPWADAAGMCLFMIGLPLLWEGARGVRPSEVGWRWDRRAAGLVGAGLLVALGGRLARRVALPGAEPAYVGRLSVLAAYWAIVACAEEHAFRAVLQRRLTALVGFAPALLLASAAFALWHGLNAPPAVIGIRLGSGLVLGLLYRIGRSLAPPVVCHWALSVALTV
jgi:membrane protease YdiL (CAAX protease family)